MTHRTMSERSTSELRPAPNATMVIYGILFGGMHLTQLTFSPGKKVTRDAFPRIRSSKSIMTRAVCCRV